MCVLGTKRRGSRPSCRVAYSRAPDVISGITGSGKYRPRTCCSNWSQTSCGRTSRTSVGPQSCHSNSTVRSSCLYFCKFTVYRSPYDDGRPYLCQHYSPADHSESPLGTVVKVYVTKRSALLKHVTHLNEGLWVCGRTDPDGLLRLSQEEWCVPSVVPRRGVRPTHRSQGSAPHPPLPGVCVPLTRDDRVPGGTNTTHTETVGAGRTVRGRRGSR